MCIDIPAPCHSTDFTCNLDNSCIPLGKKCDGISHCPDAEDERNCENGNEIHDHINYHI